MLNLFIHTYIFGHYNPSSQDYGLASHTTQVVCINFIPEWFENLFYFHIFVFMSDLRYELEFLRLINQHTAY